MEEQWLGTRGFDTATHMPSRSEGRSFAKQVAVIVQAVKVGPGCALVHFCPWSTLSAQVTTEQHSKKTSVGVWLSRCSPEVIQDSMSSAGSAAVGSLII